MPAENLRDSLDAKENSKGSESDHYKSPIPCAGERMNTAMTTTKRLDTMEGQHFIMDKSADLDASHISDYADTVRRQADHVIAKERQEIHVDEMSLQHSDRHAVTTRFNIDPELASHSPMTLRISSSPVSNFRATSKLQSLAGTLVESVPMPVATPQPQVYCLK